MEQLVDFKIDLNAVYIFLKCPTIKIETNYGNNDSYIVKYKFGNWWYSKVVSINIKKLRQ